MAWTLPPPPNLDDLTSPVWRDWFYCIGRNVEVVNPEGDQPLQAGQIFGKREQVVHPSMLGSDGDLVQAGQVFAKPREPVRVAILAVEDSNILANQIFGS